MLRGNAALGFSLLLLPVLGRSSLHNKGLTLAVSVFLAMKNGGGWGRGAKLSLRETGLIKAEP